MSGDNRKDEEASFMDYFKQCDVFPKTVDDVKEVTSSGGTLSVLMAICVLILFCSETSAFLKTHTKFEMEVDTEVDGSIQINFDLSFPAMPCSILSVDYMDVSGEHELDVVQNVFRRRLDAKGEPYGTVVHEKIHKARDPATLDRLKKDLAEKQGCNIYGSLASQKIAGNFHFSLHAHDFQVLAAIFPSRHHANMSHVIKHLSFGKDYPGILNPLDKEAHIFNETTGASEYYIKVVPTIYHQLDGTVINTNQYSVTDFFRKQLDGYPALYFVYDINPIMVHVTEWKESFLHYFTELSAIIGGVCVVAGQVHRLMRFLFVGDGGGAKIPMQSPGPLSQS